MMNRHHVGLMADPDTPTQIAQKFKDLSPGGEDPDTRYVEVVSEPFTASTEDLDTALERLQDHRHQREWDLVIGLTELPLRDTNGRYLLIETDPQHQTAILSLPALGGWRMRARTHQAVRKLIHGMSGSDSVDQQRAPLSRGSSRWRLLTGMVLANRPWRLIPGLKSALIGALATGAIATIDSTVWELVGALTPWQLMTATVVSVTLVVAWLIIDGNLWDKPEDRSPAARERSRLYNTSTLLTLFTGVLICYAALYLLNLMWSLFILDPDVMGGYLQSRPDYGDVALIAWFVTSAATVGGALGSGLDSEEAIREAAYSTREKERRERLAQQT